MSRVEKKQRPLRTAAGLFFHRTSAFNVGGYVSYSNRFVRGMAHERDLHVERIVEPLQRPAPEHTAPHIAPYSAAVELQIQGFELRLRELRADVCHVMEWGAVGTALFEACLRAGVPYVIVVIDHKPVCPQSMLLEAGRTVCEGPASTARCQACMSAFGWTYRMETLHRRREAMRYYYRRAAAVVTFTEAHAQEIDRWLGRPREEIDVVPIGVPGPQPGYRKSPAAFERPMRIGFVGRTCPEWGVELLLKAWRELAPDPADAVLDIYTCHLFAEIGLDEDVADLVAAGSVTVTTQPVFDHLDAVHANLAALVVPSQWKNNISGAGLEAFARQTPVITSDRYAFYESMPASQRELAYAFGDATSLAASLARVIGDPSILERLSHETDTGWDDADHVRGIAEVIRRAARVPVAPPARIPLGDSPRPPALVVAEPGSAWLAALDAYLSGSLDTNGAGLTIVATADGAAVEAALVEAVRRHGFDENSCPDLALLERDDVPALLPSAGVYVAVGVRDEAAHRELAARCRVPIHDLPPTRSREIA